MLRKGNKEDGGGGGAKPMATLFKHLLSSGGGGGSTSPADRDTAAVGIATGALSDLRDEVRRTVCSSTRHTHPVPTFSRFTAHIPARFLFCHNSQLFTTATLMHINAQVKAFMVCTRHMCRHMASIGELLSLALGVMAEDEPEGGDGELDAACETTPQRELHPVVANERVVYHGIARHYVA
jgi:hypothetical protein